ncbi:3-oxoacyl-[acyl-carrier-protein] reductase FabG [Ephemeroptericola cinctiostellae]|uniref:3-oxoacyl-[acyl-carrier-protein] reductase FabG n=1 Tax=Ephemeroptericola cinctiostellae TaxID=2268024 RepID=A0A345D8V8_9BURK|nr:SDR family oxidoreductase [Ephemeroptericola cinctiostellae]AXF84796.1 3-oxoacyl-[acyl-carrier-protein] reductase FabG [Ephemeroptericola cinctiostellae]
MTAFAFAPSLPRTALVTGGARRIGRTLCLSLAQAGFNVAVHYGQSADAAHTLVDELRTLNIQACALQADLNNEQAVAGLIASATSTLGTIGVLVNNASHFNYDVLTQPEPLSLTHFEQHWRTNTFAPLLLTQQLAQGLHVTQTGVVLNILDQKLHNPNPDFLSYTLSKAALEHATTLAAMALAPRVRVVGIAPGLSLPSGDQTPDDFAHAHNATILQRGSTPDDVAQAMLYALSAQGMTGTTLLVDGGQHLTTQARDVMFTHRANG